LGNELTIGASSGGVAAFGEYEGGTDCSVVARDELSVCRVGGIVPLVGLISLGEQPDRIEKNCTHG